MVFAISYKLLVVVLESVFSTAQLAVDASVVRNLPAFPDWAGRASTATQALSPLKKVALDAVPVADSSAKPTASSANLAFVTALSANSETVIAFAAISSATITSTPNFADVIALSAICIVSIEPSIY